MADRRCITGAAGRTFVRVALLTAVIFAIAGASLTWLAAEGKAQGSIEVVKTLAGSQTVRVGEVITFYITIRNTTDFSFTTVPLTDVFRADILSSVPAYLNPPADSLTYVGNSGVLSWTNLADSFGGFILPGQTVAVTLAFTAEHPTGELIVVNQAGVHDAVGIGGQSGFEGSSETGGDAVGGATPVTKTLEPLGGPPQVGLPVTFTINVRNNGAAVLSHLPLEDTYDPAVLAFNYAVPPPSQVITPTGVISWADLTTAFGPIPADTTITVTVVFTLTNLNGVEADVNRAQVAGAQDEYQNTLAPGQDQVPIQILLPATATPTATPHRHEERSPTPTSTPAPTPTPMPTPTATTIAATATATATFPALLPETGVASSGGWLPIVGGLALILAGSALLRKDKDGAKL
jgi:uncharacterized repeat protein (TIGR01451 family)/LPXTG-motif cell wall-anchored protein